MLDEKALIGVGVLWLFLIFACVILLSAEDRKSSVCEKSTALSSEEEFNGIDAIKSYAKHFPVL